MKILWLGLVAATGLAYAGDPHAVTASTPVAKKSDKAMSAKPAAKGYVVAMYEVKAWHCADCSSKTEAALKKLDGVMTVKCDVENKLCAVKYDTNKLKSAQIVKAIESSGFKPTELEHPAMTTIKPEGKKAAPKK